jgi:hypothetical protein
LKKLTYLPTNYLAITLKKKLKLFVDNRSQNSAHTHTPKLINFFKKNGFSAKPTQSILSTFSKIYNYMYKDSIFGKNLQKDYFNIKEFRFIINNTKYFNNISKTLYWVVMLNLSQFDLKSEKVSKKYKKKNKKKYLYKIKYLRKNKQISNTLK